METTKQRATIFEDRLRCERCHLVVSVGFVEGDADHPVLRDGVHRLVETGLTVDADDDEVGVVEMRRGQPSSGEFQDGVSRLDDDLFDRQLPVDEYIDVISALVCHVFLSIFTSSPCQPL